MKLHSKGMLADKEQRASFIEKVMLTRERTGRRTNYSDLLHASEMYDEIRRLAEEADHSGESSRDPYPVLPPVYKDAFA